MSNSPTIIWFRRDLRIEDNPALMMAVERGNPVAPVYIWSPEDEGDWAPGSASRWWLHQSLKSLNSALRKLGSRLVLRCGDSRRQLEMLVNETGAVSVFWNRRFEPCIIERDKRITRVLQKKGIETQSFNGSLLFEPWEVQTNQGKPYQVFTPFWKKCLTLQPPAKAQSAPKRLVAPKQWPESRPLESLELEPNVDWTGGMREVWRPGSSGAEQRLLTFLNSSVKTYRDECDRPDLLGTSRLSPHLHFGEIGPREIWHAVFQECSTDRRTVTGIIAETFLSEIGWREFAHHVLFHNPHTANVPLRSQFESFPWKKNDVALQAWQKGETGYPIVDAGMRELWNTGWMHNRVRMIVGSFLTKDLLISWHEGAKWFWETLVDADLASNTLGWQWVSGCGADAAPYFRIFNPVLQGEKFDPNGTYVRRWVPELKELPTRWIHQPWNAPEKVLRDACVEPGRTYPLPMVDHAEARQLALEAFDSISSR